MGKKRPVLGGGGLEGQDRLAHVGVRVLRDVGEPGEQGLGLLGVAVPEPLPHRLRLQAQVAEHLPDAVVQLPGQALALPQGRDDALLLEQPRLRALSAR